MTLSLAGRLPHGPWGDWKIGHGDMGYLGGKGKRNINIEGNVDVGDRFGESANLVGEHADYEGRGVQRLALSGPGGAIWMFARSCECMAWKGQRRVVGDGIE